MPPDPDMHLVLDHCATHEQPKVRAGPRARPRYHLASTAPADSILAKLERRPKALGRTAL